MNPQTDPTPSYGSRAYKGVGLGECTIDLRKCKLDKADYGVVEATIAQMSKVASFNLDYWSNKLHFKVKLDCAPTQKHASIIDDTYFSVLGIVLHKASPKKAGKLLKAAKQAALAG